MNIEYFQGKPTENGHQPVEPVEHHRPSYYHEEGDDIQKQIARERATLEKTMLNQPTRISYGDFTVRPSNNKSDTSTFISAQFQRSIDFIRSAREKISNAALIVFYGKNIK